MSFRSNHFRKSSRKQVPGRHKLVALASERPNKIPHPTRCCSPTAAESLGILRAAEHRICGRPIFSGRGCQVLARCPCRGLLPPQPCARRTRIRSPGPCWAVAAVTAPGAAASPEPLREEHSQFGSKHRVGSASAPTPELDAFLARVCSAGPRGLNAQSPARHTPGPAAAALPRSAAVPPRGPAASSPRADRAGPVPGTITRSSRAARPRPGPPRSSAAAAAAPRWAPPGRAGRAAPPQTHGPAYFSGPPPSPEVNR